MGSEMISLRESGRAFNELID